MFMKVLFIQTGGTIDKDYRKGAGVYNFEIMSPGAERILERADPSFEFRILNLMQKDSQDINDEDRQKILAACKDAPETHIIITHGTDTMTKTGEALSELSNKVIVLTGSSKPERFSTSDADFNLGMAVGALHSQPLGVYIAMSGRVLPWNVLQKNQETGQFVES
jgi:L-asparaginase